MAWEVLARETLIRQRWALEKQRVRLPGGTERDKLCIRHPGAVVILPRGADGELVLVEQYRHGTGQWLLEFPAGTLEPGEEPEGCARRELEEETGWRAATWQALGPLHPLPGTSDEVQHGYLATDLSPGNAAPEEDEQIQVRQLTVTAVEQAIVSGQVSDAKTIALFCRARLAGHL